MRSGLADQVANSKGARRRRFWSSDEKRRMVAESFTPGSSVSKVDQRYRLEIEKLRRTLYGARSERPARRSAPFL
jgi:transposase-like protein